MTTTDPHEQANEDAEEEADDWKAQTDDDAEDVIEVG